jgi:RIO-like serine/threonine protein kinase
VEASDVRLMQQLLASRHASLSLSELAARNQEGESELEEHLGDLMERGLVTTLGEESTYYAVTDEGVDLLQQADLYDQIGILHDMYEAVGVGVEDGDRPQPEWL